MLPTETTTERAALVEQAREATAAEVAHMLEEAAKPAETPEQRKARVKAHNDEVLKRFKLFCRTATQGDWIAVCRLLDMPREQIEGDTNLNLLAMAYIKDKRDHGAANMQLFLEQTDEQLLQFHGFDTSLLDEED